MTVLRSAVTQGFGLKVILEFLSFLQLYDFWKAFPHSLPTFLNVCSTVFLLPSREGPWGVGRQPAEHEPAVCPGG